MKGRFAEVGKRHFPAGTAVKDHSTVTRWGEELFTTARFAARVRLVDTNLFLSLRSD